ncbi:MULTISPECIES: DedA family protein [unclassified Paenibacillus]|uniref:DedA family protein n=1 Tax=unclassified Paenibacillus TaxID=185978 RepID=UPI0036348114
MSINHLIEYIQHFGYFALFFALWLGIVGMPIPDEVVVMTGGMVGSFQLLHPVPAFIVTYLGVVSGLSLGYVLGRIMGPPVLEKLQKRKKIGNYISKSNELLNRYGSFALSLSYFLPVVRHVIPYLVGVNKMSFSRYALISYSTGLIWTSIYFTLGSFFGNNIELIGKSVYKYGWFMLIAICIVLVVRWLIKNLPKKKVYTD